MSPAINNASKGAWLGGYARWRLSFELRRAQSQSRRRSCAYSHSCSIFWWRWALLEGVPLVLGTIHGIYHSCLFFYILFLPRLIAIQDGGRNMDSVRFFTSAGLFNVVFSSIWQVSLTDFFFSTQWNPVSNAFLFYLNLLHMRMIFLTKMGLLMWVTLWEYSCFH